MMAERKPATSIEALDAHLWYMQEAVDSIKGAVAEMATKKDIEDLAKRLDGYATKAQLEDLKRQLESETPGSLIKRLAALARDLLPIIALVGAVWAFMVGAVHIGDFVKAAKPAAHVPDTATP